MFDPAGRIPFMKYRLYRESPRETRSDVRSTAARFIFSEPIVTISTTPRAEIPRRGRPKLNRRFGFDTGCLTIGIRFRLNLISNARRPGRLNSIRQFPINPGLLRAEDVVRSHRLLFHIRLF
jgi:hypothetical protein